MKIQKLISILLAILISISLQAKVVLVDGIYYDLNSDYRMATVTYKRNNDVFFPIDHSFYKGDIKIPKSISYNGKTYNVVGVGANAFSDSEITSVNIPNSVDFIGEKAFRGCSCLTSINIPSSVSSIGDMVFIYSSNLKYVNVEEGNKVFDSRDNCNAIINTSTNTLVAGCMNTKIPNTVTSIGYRAFIYCISLKSITIPNSVTTIERFAFHGCSGLESLIIKNGLKTIEGESFQHCTSLTSINIPNSVTSIGGLAFNGCKSLTSINIPYSVTSIGSGAFDGCTSLTSINIPNSVTSIGYSVFRDCTNLTSVNIPNSVTEIDSYAFQNCTSLASVTIPNCITEIDLGVFEGCTSLASVNIPQSVTDIGIHAFYGCIGLKEIHCDAIIPPKVFASFDGVDVRKVYLFVPEGSIQKYKDHKEWGRFNIDTETAIKPIVPDNREELPIYNIGGQRIKSIQKGLSIVNGRKVMVK